jgi:hypothetical protein
MPTRVLNLAAILLAAVSAVGCATALPEPTAAAETPTPGKIRVAVREKQSAIQAVSDWPQNGVAASAAGGALGAIGGVVIPYAWLVGGPFFTGPYVAVKEARCAHVNGQVQGVAAQFEEIARGVDLAGFRSAFVTAADGHAERRGQGLRGAHPAGQSAVTLEILAVELRLGNVVMACTRPEVQAIVKWRAIWTGTGEEIDARTSTVGDGRGSSRTQGEWLREVRQWLSSTESSRAQLAAMLERVGRTVAGELFAVAD